MALQYQWPLEGLGPETHEHKITIIPVFYMALDVGKSITRTIESGGSS
jgi:hypothetical protein